MNNTPQAYKLGDAYDPALMGATIRGQFVYSLSKLTEIETSRQGIPEDAAREFIAEQVIEVTRMWEDAAPVFVDDTLLPPPLEVTLTIPEEGPKIITPRGFVRG